MKGKMQMKIGIIGTGGIGKAFARQVTKADYDVIVSNSRGPESLTGGSGQRTRSSCQSRHAT